MHFKILLLTAVFSAAVHTTTAFPQGAPGYACKTLRPSHIGSPKTQEDETSPYRLSTNTTTLVPGGAVAVQITAPGSSFKGFLCAASDMSDSGHAPLGSMSLGGSRVCVREMDVRVTHRLSSKHRCVMEQTLTPE